MIKVFEESSRGFLILYTYYTDKITDEALFQGSLK